MSRLWLMSAALGRARPKCMAETCQLSRDSGASLEVNVVHLKTAVPPSLLLAAL